MYSLDGLSLRLSEPRNTLDKNSKILVPRTREDGLFMFRRSIDSRTVLNSTAILFEYISRNVELESESAARERVTGSNDDSQRDVCDTSNRLNDGGDTIGDGIWGARCTMLRSSEQVCFRAEAGGA